MAKKKMGNKAIPYAYISTTEELEPMARRQRLNELLDLCGGCGHKRCEHTVRTYKTEGEWVAAGTCIFRSTCSCPLFQEPSARLESANESTMRSESERRVSARQSAPRAAFAPYLEFILAAILFLLIASALFCAALSWVAA